MDKKKQTFILLVFYYLQFNVGGLWGIFLPHFTNSQETEPHVLSPLEPELLEKKIPGDRSRSCLGKKSGAGAAWRAGVAFK